MSRSFGGTLAALAVSAVTAATLLSTPAAATNEHAALLLTNDSTGILSSVASDGQPIQLSGPFFESFGTNGRTCATCHVPDEAWTISPPQVQLRFNASNGLDPLFRTVDGANAPSADTSTVEKRRQAYSMLLDKGLIRVGIGLPAGAEFELIKVDDPYHFASAQQLSLFRRPLPSTNLRFLSTLMWDGRESSTVTGTVPITSPANLLQDLAHQSLDATLGHAQAVVPGLTSAQQQQIVDFEMGLSTAQAYDSRAGSLHDDGAMGGAPYLSAQAFHIGINDTLGGDPDGDPFNRDSMTLFGGLAGSSNELRAKIALGEQLFDEKQFTISGVGGLNDAPGVPASFKGTCTTCHNAPNAGNHSVSLPLNLGLTDASRRTPDMPLYTLRNVTTGEIRQSTDPGRALITGKWADVGKFKGPVLRGLVARAPYFHNGSAATLDDAVEFYNQRFSIGLTDHEHHALVAFLRSL